MRHKLLAFLCVAFLALPAATASVEVADGLLERPPVEARVISRSPDEVFLDEISLIDDNHLNRFTTSVRIRIGQTLVLGSAERFDDRATVILTVRAESTE